MPTRYDSFIVWGHGIPYLSEMMTVLRAKFKIILIHRHTITDMAKFVDDIYACDSYPLRHLRNKTRYLLSTPMEAYFILVKNSNVNEKLVGKGKWRKPQCEYVQGVKKALRARYNPGSKPEHHVIHGTDYETQVHHLLKVFGLKPLAYYTRNEGSPFPWHIAQKPYDGVAVEIDSLYSTIISQGKVRVKDTPHYKYTTGSREEYTEYFNKYRGRQLKEDHFTERFDELMDVDTFYPIIIKGDLILDGLHRSAIELSRGKKTIKALKI